MLVIAIAVGVLILLGETPVHAYIDPDTGSLIYQTILAVALGLGFALRTGRASVSRFVKRLSGHDAPSPSGTSAPDA